MKKKEKTPRNDMPQEEMGGDPHQENRDPMAQSDMSDGSTEEMQDGNTSSEEMPDPNAPTSTADTSADDMPADDMMGADSGAERLISTRAKLPVAFSSKHDQLFPPMPVSAGSGGDVMEMMARSEISYAELLESQCGNTDDSQPVEQYDGTLGVTTAFVGQHQRPVGQLQWNTNLATIYTNPGNVAGVRWCTGTLISNDLFITAGHCFDQNAGTWQLPRINGTNTVISSAEIASVMHVNFNYQVDPSNNPRIEQEFPILDLLEYRLGGLDYAIVRLGGNPGATFGQTEVSDVDATESEMICIIGHPAGLPKRIEAGPVTDLHGNQIGYNDIDTLGGNSGSGILQASTGRIVGIHTNGGCTASDPNPDANHNHGVRISSIRRQSPILQNLGASRPSSGPVVAWGANRLDAFVIGTNSALYHKWWNGSAWGPSVSGYEAMGGTIIGRAEAVAWGPNRLDVFVIGTNSALYHKWWNGSAWGPSLTGYEAMGGTIIGHPRAVAWGPNRLDVFVIGTNSGLYHKWWNGSAWGPSLTGYESMGGKIIGDPEVVSWGPNRLDVFVIGTNSALYHKWWNGSAWGPSLTGYEAMGGTIIGQPRAVAWGPNRLDVFVIGTDAALYHKWWNGSSWGPSLTGYEFMGGKIIGDPEVVSWGPNRLDIFVIGTDSALYHKWWNGSSWGPSLTGYESLGGTIIGQPRVVSWGPNRLDIFVIGTDSALYHKWWNGSAWGPSKLGWEKLGGVITRF
ncbi:V8-like Glu-specific endopeptidase [Lewinella aquimaris]|uniref:V8-like Glu-specific endopeptidase n=1 Tax=Neolewinella aquimaris TaxID=1835722 RepID=A0A840E6G0_9BACT|nr:trypsin-like peptidase domain-containing protein [Neolewinella aquimaris]MBB4080640.1 V8-like Glu-specific endopeptidase [Neolewinella aquimaris]